MLLRATCIIISIVVGSEYKARGIDIHQNNARSDTRNGIVIYPLEYNARRGTRNGIVIYPSEYNARRGTDNDDDDDDDDDDDTTVLLLLLVCR